tara:strand:+ start:2464 stop:4929 length:2466 start_codon:yes stop_codon:yes gene_type:complete
MKEIEDKVTDRLSISAHVVVQLGEELVTDKEQAILELVKNCYDADTTDCNIHIEPDWKISPKTDLVLYHSLFPEKLGMPPSSLKEETVGRIVIEDDGDGMNAKTVTNSWLRISSSPKRPAQGQAKKARTSGRVPVGDKGLGRLATMKLGKIIRLETSIAGEKETRSLWFSWDDFTEQRELSQVPVHSEIPIPKSNSETKGSKITIIGLKELSNWRQESFVSRDLVRNLSNLVSPFLEKQNFFISIHYKNNIHEISHLSDQALNLASSEYHWKWNGKSIHHSGRISEKLFLGAGTGRAKEEFDLVFHDKATREKFVLRLLADKKLKDFHFREKNSPGFFAFSYEDSVGDPLPRIREYANAKNPGNFEARIYDFNLSYKEKQALSAIGVTTEQIKSSNVQIFRDGFLVRYDGDWLGLANEQTAGSSYYGFRPGNTIGYFSVSNAFNPRLIEKSDREAFVDNDEFRGFLYLARRAKDKENTLRELLRRAYTSFLKEISSERSLSSSPSEAAKIARDEMKKDTVILKGAIENLESLDGKSSEDAVKSRDKAIQSLREFATKHEETSAQIDFVKRHLDSTEDFNLKLLEAAAVGLTARSISHELHQYSRQFKQGIDHLKAENNILKNRTISASLRLLVSTLKELTKMIGALDPMLPGSRQIKEDISVIEFVKEYLLNRKDWALKKNIEIEVIDETVNGLTIRFNTSRLLQILENLLQNSVYWLNAYKKAKLPSQKITVTINDSEIIWSDNGPGVNSLYEGSLFEPFISDKPSGEGQGLGLHISTVFLNSENCTLSLGKPRNELGRRYQFHISLIAARSHTSQEVIF